MYLLRIFIVLLCYLSLRASGSALPVADLIESLDSHAKDLVSQEFLKQNPRLTTAILYDFLVNDPLKVSQVLTSEDFHIYSLIPSVIVRAMRLKHHDLLSRILSYPNLVDWNQERGQPLKFVMEIKEFAPLVLSTILPTAGVPIVTDEHARDILGDYTFESVLNLLKPSQATSSSEEIVFGLIDWISSFGKLEKTQVLFDRLAEIHALNSNHVYVALHFATAQNQRAVIKYLMNGKHVKVLSSVHLSTLILMSALKGDLDLVDILIPHIKDNLDEQILETLHEAASIGYFLNRVALVKKVHDTFFPQLDWNDDSLNSLNTVRGSRRILNFCANFGDIDTLKLLFRQKGELVLSHYLLDSKLSVLDSAMSMNKQSFTQELLTLLEENKVLEHCETQDIEQLVLKSLEHQDFPFFLRIIQIYEKRLDVHVHILDRWLSPRPRRIMEFLLPAIRHRDQNAALWLLSSKHQSLHSAKYWNVFDAACQYDLPRVVSKLLSIRSRLQEGQQKVLYRNGLLDSSENGARYVPALLVLRPDTSSLIGKLPVNEFIHTLTHATGRAFFALLGKAKKELTPEEFLNVVMVVMSRGSRETLMMVLAAGYLFDTSMKRDLIIHAPKIDRVGSHETFLTQDILRTLSQSDLRHIYAHCIRHKKEVILKSFLLDPELVNKLDRSHFGDDLLQGLSLGLKEFSKALLQNELPSISPEKVNEAFLLAVKDSRLHDIAVSLLENYRTSTKLKPETIIEGLKAAVHLKARRILYRILSKPSFVQVIPSGVLESNLQALVKDETSDMYRIFMQQTHVMDKVLKHYQKTFPQVKLPTYLADRIRAGFSHPGGHQVSQLRSNSWRSFFLQFVRTRTW